MFCVFVCVKCLSTVIVYLILHNLYKILPCYNYLCNLLLSVRFFYSGFIKYQSLVIKIITSIKSTVKDITLQDICLVKVLGAFV